MPERNMRSEGRRAQRRLILVVCEGEQSEYLYLTGLARHYRLSGVRIEPGRGKDPTYQIERALTLRAAQVKNREPFDETWVVLDREATREATQFRTAIRQAETNGLRLAISNPCFEYWYLLHFLETSQPFLHCADVVARLRQNDCLPDYRKHDSLFPQLAASLEDSCRRARRLRDQHPDSASDRFPNPSTLVDLLIDALLYDTKR